MFAKHFGHAEGCPYKKLNFYSAPVTVIGFKANGRNRLRPYSNPLRFQVFAFHFWLSIQ
jgi:hypothetical protein